MGASVVDVTAESFQAEVIDRSREVPVLVDFWATWCGPCRTLSPVLEKLATEMQGRFVLAKVDVDREPDLAQAFRVQSIPSVMLLSDGKVADAFLGARSEAGVRQFLEPHLLPARESGSVERAHDLEKEGRADEAVALLREHLEASPSDGCARVELARALFDAGRIGDARLEWEKVSEPDRESHEAQVVKTKLEFSIDEGELAALALEVTQHPERIDRRIAYGKALIAAKRPEEGLAELFEAARRDLHFDGDAPRKALLEAFRVVGEEDPAVLEYQRRLSVLLCS